jgi:tetratricopeptide (TPR) repeat protein
MAQIAIEREGKMQAIRLLEKTLATVKRPEQKLDIILKIANLSIELRRYEEAIELLKSAPRKKEFSERLYLIDDALLRCYLKTGDYQRALSQARRMRATKRYVAHLDEISLSHAIALKELGRTAEAVEELEALTNEDVEARLRGKAWLELALLYQHAIGDLEQALECYGNAISLLGDEEERELARTRKAAIERLYALSDSVAAFTPDTADTIDRLSDMRYKIGETWWLRLDEPDSALDQFERIVSDSAADSAAVMKALFARAWIFQSMKKDSAAADSLFRLVARRYPATEFAKKSQAALGSEVTLMTRADSAAAAFSKAERLYVRDNNPLAASRAYLAVARTYKDLDIAARSLYAAGWLCDNVLDKNVTARKIYMKLCDEYPRSSYCQQEAQPRLTVVSDTLNALRARKTKEKDDSDVPDANGDGSGGDGRGDDSEIEVEGEAGTALETDAADE